LAGATSGGHRDPVVRSAKGGVGAGCISRDRKSGKRQIVIELGTANFHYIAAITKAQIDGLIGAGVLHMDLFEETLAEVEGKDGERYVVRRDSARAKELAASRPDKLATLRTAELAADKCSSEHPRAAAKTQVSRLNQRAKMLHIDKFVRGVAQRTLRGLDHGPGRVD
jgi:hypothetical protein